jgi:hypothetical protein
LNCFFGMAFGSNEMELSHRCGGERSKLTELFHKIKFTYRDGQRLAPAIG